MFRGENKGEQRYYEKIATVHQYVTSLAEMLCMQKSKKYPRYLQIIFKYSFSNTV